MADDEVRYATLMERLKRLAGGDTGPDVIQPWLLSQIMPTPGEGYEQDLARSRHANTQQARVLILEEKRKEDRRKLLLKRKQDAEDKAFYDWLMPTMGDVGGVPEGSPSYVRENTLTTKGADRVMGAVEMHNATNPQKE